MQVLHLGTVVRRAQELDAFNLRVCERQREAISEFDQRGGIEQRLWPQAGVKVRKGGSHRQCKCSASAALDIAAAAYGYTLVDRGAWAAFRNRGDLAVLVEDDPKLMLTFSAPASW